MKIPTNEEIVVTYTFEGIKEYVVTHNALKGKFTLYRIMDNDYEKLKVATSPLEFDEIVKEDREI